MVGHYEKLSHLGLPFLELHKHLISRLQRPFDTEIHLFFPVHMYSSYLVLHATPLILIQIKDQNDRLVTRNGQQR